MKTTRLRGEEGYSLVYVLMILAMIAVLLPPLVVWGMQRSQAVRLEQAQQQADAAAQAALTNELAIVKVKLLADASLSGLTAADLTLQASSETSPPAGAGLNVLHLGDAASTQTLPDGTVITTNVVPDVVVGTGVNLMNTQEPLLDVGVWIGMTSSATVSVPTSVAPGGTVRVTLHRAFTALDAGVLQQP
ncbi:hypothetical protein JI721_15350 [Alicyclobacillus cycloheptanicus]|uniref:Type II secretory pathway pseudopilin PulG n=1 Tax=Alicyclobacillus cycloheptanicus TaxID=1457 RepID=A0ABT9XE09_9BACL|nr:hypothetical protein [Alicyclobacillus cycloheptanicus]MDQ0188314.1 type II secretory pathway pseudopilin PulG [Alicyclobacillus cycloheptanicus]WDM01028.1 hypothetical protein JI721_15350 [Alicyclobacillus cycloheptanicus]